MTREPCPRCKGEGYVKEAWERPDCTDPAADHFMLVNCEECGGTGTVAAEPGVNEIFTPVLKLWGGR